LGTSDCRVQVLDVFEVSVAPGAVAPELGRRSGKGGGAAAAGDPGPASGDDRCRAGAGQLGADGASGRMALRGRGVFARGDCALLWPVNQLFEVPARPRAQQIAPVVRARRGSADMHNPVEKTNPPTQSGVDALRRLPTELEPPYHWQEFKR